MAAAESGVWFFAENYKPADPGYRYAVLGIQFWEAYKVRGNIDDACAAVREEASKQPDAVFSPIYYGWGNPGPTLDTFCPFHSEEGG